MIITCNYLFVFPKSHYPTQPLEVSLNFVGGLKARFGRACNQHAILCRKKAFFHTSKLQTMPPFGDTFM